MCNSNIVSLFLMLYFFKKFEFCKNKIFFFKKMFYFKFFFLKPNESNPILLNQDLSKQNKKKKSGVIVEESMIKSK